jgi:hypothetical protein
MKSLKDLPNGYSISQIQGSAQDGAWMVHGPSEHGPLTDLAVRPTKQEAIQYAIYYHEKRCTACGAPLTETGLSENDFVCLVCEGLGAPAKKSEATKVAEAALEDIGLLVDLINELEAHSDDGAPEDNESVLRRLKRIQTMLSRLRLEADLDTGDK